MKTLFGNVYILNFIVLSIIKKGEY